MQILEAAKRVFARDGYHRARMEAIARESGIGKGTVYEYFSSKRELFLALHAHMLSQFKSFYQEELSGITDPPLLLERFIIAAFKTFRLWEPFFLVFFDFWAEGGREEQQALLRTQLREAYASARRDLAQIIDAGIKAGTFHCDEPLLASSCILASLDGLVFQWLCDRDAFDLDSISRSFLGSTLRSLRP